MYLQKKRIEDAQGDIRKSIKMKKVLFILSDLERGGIPRVTLNMLAELDPKRVSADVFCGNPCGIFLAPLCRMPHVRLLSCSCLLRAIMSNYRKETGLNKFFVISVKIIRMILQRVIRFDLLKWLENRLGQILSHNTYYAVFATHEGFPADLALLTQTHQRIIWLHSDYSNEAGSNAPGLREKLNKFDGILCVAEHAKDALCEHFPELAPKAHVLYNIVNETEIHQMADMEIPRDQFSSYNGFKIVSIGRFCNVPKQFSVIPEICCALQKKGLSFHWYLIGNGSPEETAIITESIAKYHSENVFILLGERANPYVYLKNSDLFVLTSKYETYPTVVNEAKVLGIPIVSTDFKGCHEIIFSDDGIITPIKNFPCVIEKIIREQERKQSRVRKKTDFSDYNQKVMSDFYSLIGL